MLSTMKYVSMLSILFYREMLNLMHVESNLLGGDEIC